MQGLDKYGTLYKRQCLSWLAPIFLWDAEIDGRSAAAEAKNSSIGAEANQSTALSCTRCHRPYPAELRVLSSSRLGRTTIQESGSLAVSAAMTSVCSWSRYVTVGSTAAAT